MTYKEFFKKHHKILSSRAITKENPYGYDGKTIATKNRPINDIIHDIAHWLVCSKNRRNSIDFGLGAGPDTWDLSWMGRDLLREISKISAKKEESLASLLGIYYLYKFDLDWKDELFNHEWKDVNWETGRVFDMYPKINPVKKVMAKLINKGLISNIEGKFFLKEYNGFKFSKENSRFKFSKRAM